MGKGETRRRMARRRRESREIANSFVNTGVTLFSAGWLGSKLIKENIDDEIVQGNYEDLQPTVEEKKLIYKTMPRKDQTQQKADTSKIKNKWREYCEDGSAYGISPYDYSSADAYNEALKAAKEKATSSATPPASSVVANDLPTDAKNAPKPVNSAEINKYTRRKYCEDGSPYGIFPDNYETADEYADALARAKALKG